MMSTTGSCLCMTSLMTGECRVRLCQVRKDRLQKRGNSLIKCKRSGVLEARSARNLAAG